MDTKLIHRLLVTLIMSVSAIGISTFAEEPVVFADTNLKIAVEEALEKQDPTPSDMLNLEWLPQYYDYEYRGLHLIGDLTGLEYAKNLEQFALENSPIDDYSVLSKLQNLRSLMLASCDISDVSPLVSAISDLENLKVLSLKNNQIADISPLVNLKNLNVLHLHGNPLNEEAYKTYIPQIRKSNPGIEISMNYRLEQLYAPAVLFFLFLVIAIYAVYRNWNTKRWIFELLVGLVSAAVGVYLGLGAQILYVFSDGFLEFFGNGYENPLWVGGVIGGTLGFLVGVWFVQNLRYRLNQGQSKGMIVGKGILVGIVLGVICSSSVHILLMTAYRNLDLRPLLIGAIFALVAGFVTGLVMSVIFVISHKIGLVKVKESI